ncbi:MAG TPA: ABC transporter permease [Thermomicrobiales bacterium]|jgi:peptide/nickel transport system permease protein
MSSSAVVTATAQPLTKAGKSRGLYSDALRRFRRNRVALAGLIVLFLLILIAICAPLLALHDPTQFYFNHKLEAPSSVFPLGTDNLGRDVYSRMLYGSRISLPTGLIAVGIALLLGVPIGTVAGYFGKAVDTILMRGCDVVLAFPSILFAIWLISIFGPSLRNVMIAVGLFSVPSFARLVRSTILSAKETDYITAERALGAGTFRILTRHILPNVIQPVIIIASLRVASAILAAAGLSFLGLGVRPPTPEWGAMLSEGRAYLTIAWWVTFFPGLAIMITVLATNMVGDGLRDALDPRQQGR